MNVRRGDTVEIIVGDENEKGKRGKILSASPDTNKVVVENLNIVKKHKKPRNAQDKGGILDQPRPIDASNVMIVCPKCDKTTRVGHKVDEKGKTVRICKKCGAALVVRADKTQKKAAAKKKAAKESSKEE